MSSQLTCERCKKYRGIDDPEICTDCMEKELLKAEAMDCVNKMTSEKRVIALNMLTAVFTRDPQFEIHSHDNDNPTVRTCTKCHRTLTLEGFNYRASRPRSLCKDCEQLHGKLYGIKSIVDSTRARIGLYNMLKLLFIYGQHCPDCGVRMCNFVNSKNTQGPDDVTVDHIIPYTFWATDQLENLRLCCRRCNGKKSDRLIWDLIVTHGLIEEVEKRLSLPEFIYLKDVGEIWPWIGRAA